MLASLVLNSFLMYFLVARIFRSQMLELESVPQVTLSDFTVQFSGLPLRFQNEEELREIMEREGPVFDCIIGANLDGAAMPLACVSSARLTWLALQVCMPCMGV